MSIEFYCPQCAAFLRTPEAKGGLSVECPACWERIWIPLESQAYIPAERWAGVETVRPEPWRTPPAAVPETDSSVDVRSPSDDIPFRAVSRRADLAEILRLSWQIYSRNLGLCLLATLFDLLLTVATIFVALIPAALCAFLLRDSPILGIPAIMLTLFLGWTTAFSAAAAGHYRFFLAMARGEPVRVSHMFQSGDCLGRMAVAGVAFWAIAVFGFCMCILPGILAMVLLWPYGRFVVDQEAPASQSLSDAFRLTSENFWTSLLIVLTNFLVIISANFIPILGFLFAVPFAAVLHTVAYLRFRGEAVAGA